VLHHEGLSHGTTIVTGIKSFQAVNQGKFVQRWRGVLNDEHFDNGRHVFLARDRSRAKPCVIMVEASPLQSGASADVSNLLYRCAELGMNVKLWTQAEGPDSVGRQELQQSGVEVVSGSQGSEAETRFGEWLHHNGQYVAAVVLRQSNGVDWIPLIKRHSKARIVQFGGESSSWATLTAESVSEILNGDSTAEGRPPIRAGALVHR